MAHNTCDNKCLSFLGDHFINPCLCDAKQPTTVVESGTINAKDYFPIKAISVGDVDAHGEEKIITYGALHCSGGELENHL